MNINKHASKKMVFLYRYLVIFGVTIGIFTQTTHADPFAFKDVLKKAATLAEHPYEAPEHTLPADLNLSYDEYQYIHYKADQAPWHQEHLPFELQFFHRGFFYHEKVAINLIENGSPKLWNYSPKQFTFDKLQFKTPLTEDLGFAGFKILMPEKTFAKYNELAVFLGASYFRAVGRDQHYGLSVRGLAIDTGLNKPEEFPLFKEFWIEKPTPQADSLTFYALLDSPSISGAYQFRLHPDNELTIDVHAQLFPRKSIERLGISPITSMFYTGKNKDHFVDEYRPEVHDSDGLLMKKSTHEWLWRPLINPSKVSLSVIKDETLAGFGLIQRERDASQYQDYSEEFQNRPSVWVEPLDTFDPGSVSLVEIPSDAEIYDNIVAFWTPDAPIQIGTPLVFNYRLHFLLKNPNQESLATVVATRLGAGGSGGLTPEKRRFVIDFEHARLTTPLQLTAIHPIIHSSKGNIQAINILESADKKLWRVVFELDPKDNPGPIELSAYLATDQQRLSETWLYQWQRRT